MEKRRLWENYSNTESGWNLVKNCFFSTPCRRNGTPKMNILVRHSKQILVWIQCTFRCGWTNSRMHRGKISSMKTTLNEYRYSLIRFRFSFLNFFVVYCCCCVRVTRWLSWCNMAGWKLNIETHRSEFIRHSNVYVDKNVRERVDR